VRSLGKIFTQLSLGNPRAERTERLGTKFLAIEMHPRKQFQAGCTFDANSAIDIPIYFYSTSFTRKQEQPKEGARSMNNHNQTMRR
jgi:hypothetical protein